MRSFILGLVALLFASSVWAAGLVGTWRGSLDGEDLVLDLRADGSGTLSGDPIRYQLLGNQLLVQSADGELMAYTTQQKGNTLVVSGGDLDGSIMLTRGKAAAKPQSKEAPSSAGGAGGVRKEMVGRWCYVSSFSANAGGGSQTERCFELRPDGSYVYNYENSMSANAPGMWGGTTSSSGDQGRWTATANSLTAHSAGGGSTTYALEKRNHPKTRDPMLCLNGDCYATHWQKPSW